MSKQSKKKSQKVMTLHEFNQATPLVPEAQTPASMNWADEMDNLDDTAKPVDFTFDRSQLPSATQAYAEPDIDLAQVPSKPPFTAHISNISFEASEDQVRQVLSGILNFRVPLDERGTLRGHGFVDFIDRESLIEALKKNNTQLLKRPMRIQLESTHRQQRPGRDQDLRSDEADWRSHRSIPDEDIQPSRGYGDQQRRGGGGGGYGQQRHQQGFRKDMGSHQQGYQQRDNFNQGYQRRQHSGFKSNRFENSEADVQSTSSGTTTPTVSLTERPKLTLAPRTKSSTESKSEERSAQSAIFGSAKPVNTAAREREIEEKLKRDKLEAERLEKERREREEVQEEEGTVQEEDFHVVSGKPRINKNDNNNNTIKNRPGSNVSPQQRYHKKSETEPAKENAWKTKSSAAELFHKESPEALNSQGGTRASSNDQRRSYPPRRTEYQNRDRAPRDNYNRDNKDNRDNRDKRFSERVKPMNKNPRGERQSENRPMRPKSDLASAEAIVKKASIDFNNKFSNLAVDVEDAEEIFGGSNDEQEK